MKAPFLLPCLLGLASLLNADAQQPLIPPLPRGPLLNNAPNYAQWLISVSSQPFQLDSQTPPTKFDSRTLERKTGSIREQISIAKDQPKLDTWIEGATQCESIEGQKDPRVVLQGNSTFGTDYIDFSKGDFFGFDWIKKKNYYGQKNVMGQKCILFHISPPPDPSTAGPSAAPATAAAASPTPDPLETGTTACIAIDTRLPVVLKETDQTTFYEFQQPPSAPLAPPPQIQAQFDKLNAAVKRMTTVPAP